MSRAARAHDRAWRWLAGADGVRPGLPCAELLAPVPLAAIALVAINDWWWKPHATWPAAWTGKLSDLGGVIALPLVLTAALGLALRAAARLGAPVDWTLRRWKLDLALALTAAAVAATKLSPDVAAWVAARLGKDAQIYVDFRTTCSRCRRWWCRGGTAAARSRACPTAGSRGSSARGARRRRR